MKLYNSSKHPLKMHQLSTCRVCWVFCLTASGIVYLTWQFAVLKSITQKTRIAPLHQREIDLNIFSDIQTILLNTSNYEDIFFRDPDVSCRYPIGDPLDKREFRYYEKKTIRCETDDDRAVIDHVEGLRMKPEMVRGNEFCFYSEITRPQLEDKAIFSLRAPLVGVIHPKSDFTSVECTDENGTVLSTDYFAHVQRLKDIKEYNISDMYSVAVIGIGRLSRLNFMRQMPRSYSYMKNKLGSIEMLGFTIHEKAPHRDIVAMIRGNESFVFSKYIWEYYSQAGAVTLFAEDVPNMNMFKTRRQELKRQPTHHYGNTFWDAVKESQKAKRSEEDCFGKRPRHLLHLTYLLSFLRAYKNSPSFLFSLYNELTRNHINRAQMMDDDFVDFLENTVREDLLRQTVLIVIGVSGQHVPETTQGWMEETMPLVSVILPQSAPQQWKDALQVNRKRLTSPHDLYQTFVEILGSLTPAQTNVKFLKKLNTGTSLFTEISATRSCQDAGIVDERCVCQESVK